MYTLNNEPQQKWADHVVYRACMRSSTCHVACTLQLWVHNEPLHKWADHVVYRAYMQLPKKYATKVKLEDEVQDLKDDLKKVINAARCVRVYVFI